MFTDARALPPGTTIEASVCIAGAGAAGITLARAFARSGHKVAVLESGGLDFEEETQSLYAGEIVGRPFNPLDVDRLRYFGGTTGHWSGGCRPFDPIDFEPGSGGAPGDGWPFGRDALEPYYRGAQEICQLGPYAWEPEDWIEGNVRPLPLGPDARMRTGMFQYSPPTRFGEVYRADLERADAVTVYLHANLIEIETTANAAETTAFRVACLGGGPVFRVRAKYYVLALGGIENARILLGSDRVQAGGVGNARDLVGRFFMDHAEVAGAATVVFDEHGAAAASLPFYEKREIRGQSVQGFVTADPETRRREGLPAFGIGFQPGALPNKEFAKRSLKALYRSARSLEIPENLGFHVTQILRGIEWQAESVYRRITGGAPAFYSTMYVCGAAPDRDSRVTLGHERDALGMRRVQLDWRLPADFERHMVRAHELLAEDLGRAGLGRVRINSRETAGSDDPVAEIGNGSHHMGTTRMHRDPAYGVVDENCRVHGTANLYVAGSSVFPTYGMDNPTMTIVALALRLADHLRPMLA
jgi:choline dehydrogenase-like flavoprotein